MLWRREQSIILLPPFHQQLYLPPSVHWARVGHKNTKVNISILNDSKYITAIIYVSSLVVVVKILVTFVSGNLQNFNEAFFSGGLMLSTYIFPWANIYTKGIIVEF